MYDNLKLFLVQRPSVEHSPKDLILYEKNKLCHNKLYKYVGTLKTIMNLKELTEKMHGMFDRDYKDYKDEWSQRIDYFNSIVSLLWAFILAVSSTILIQASLYIFRNYFSEKTFVTINFVLVLVFFIISSYIIILFILSRIQIHRGIKESENKINSLRESLKHFEKLNKRFIK